MASSGRPDDARDRPRSPAMPGARAGQPVERGGRQLDVRQHDVGLEGGVAEEHVEQLGGVAGGGGERLGDGHPMGDPRPPDRSRSTRPSMWAATQGSRAATRARQLDGLLEHQRLGAHRDGGRARPDQIGRLEPALRRDGGRGWLGVGATGIRAPGWATTPESTPTRPARRTPARSTPASTGRLARVLSTPWLTVSPFEVTGWPWSGRVLVTPGPRVDCPVSVLVTPFSA